MNLVTKVDKATKDIQFSGTISHEELCKLNFTSTQKFFMDNPGNRASDHLWVFQFIFETWEKSKLKSEEKP